MQLFLCDYQKNEDVLTISDMRVTRQCFTVLRMQAGDLFRVSSGEGGQRFQVSVMVCTKRVLTGRVVDSLSYTSSLGSVSLLVALPNSSKKRSLIVQKLTEVGVDSIVFWPGNRSQQRVLEEKKRGKLTLVAREAAEQSWRWTVPTVRFVESVEALVGEVNHLVVFDIPRLDVPEQPATHQTSGSLVGVVGPEGGLTSDDHADLFRLCSLAGATLEWRSLGATVLRMETAAIVAGWSLCQGVG